MFLTCCCRCTNPSINIRVQNKEKKSPSTILSLYFLQQISFKNQGVIFFSPNINTSERSSLCRVPLMLKKIHPRYHAKLYNILTDAEQKQNNKASKPWGNTVSSSVACTLCQLIRLQKATNTGTEITAHTVPVAAAFTCPHRSRPTEDVTQPPTPRPKTVLGPAARGWDLTGEHLGPSAASWGPRPSMAKRREGANERVYGAICDERRSALSYSVESEQMAFGATWVAPSDWASRPPRAVLSCGPMPDSWMP